MTAREISDLWVVEYSPSQKAVHVQQLGESVQNNSRQVLEGKRTDYVPVGIAQSHEQASAICSVFETKLKAAGLR